MPLMTGSPILPGTASISSHSNQFITHLFFHHEISPVSNRNPRSAGILEHLFRA